MSFRREITVDRLSAALRAFDVLEPWLTESHWDEHYWDAEAVAVVALLDANPSVQSARTSIGTVLREAFPSDGFRPEFEDLLDSVVAKLLAETRET